MTLLKHFANNESYDNSILVRFPKIPVYYMGCNTVSTTYTDLIVV